MGMERAGALPSVENCEFSVIEARLSRELTAISINGFEADLTGAAMNRLLFTLAAALAVISLIYECAGQQTN
jgi:hypothetical protein